MIDTIEIQSADSVSHEAVAQALNLAYQDYLVPIHLTPAGFQRLIERESVVMAASRVALDGERIIGMGLLGIRDARGWIGGMGVIPSHRRQGIARRLMLSLIGQAQQLALKTLQLEVITRNKAAYKLYKSLGFETRRELLVLSYQKNGIKRTPEEIAESISVSSEPVDNLIPHLANLPGVRRPWQRELTPELPERSTCHLQGYLATDVTSQSVRGVCLYTGNGFHAEVVDMAAMDDTVGLALSMHLLKNHPTTTFTYLNVAQEDPQLSVLQQAGFSESIRQYEMFLSI